MQNMQTSQMVPLPGASPPFPAYLYPISKQSVKEEQEKNNKKSEKNEKAADQVQLK